MAMRDGTRRWLMRLAWGGLLVALSVLVGLRIGRPVYYTDGQQQRNGADLQGSGMLEWGTPEVVVELPGPVHGRVAELPDGRLLYGRGLADGSTDLVVFDPRQPRVPPEPAYGLNSPHNELAPAVGADGRVYFASDRPAGAGGYDLYAAAWQGSAFAAPEPLLQCNTRFDETDPAPSPVGAQFVFVRIDRAVDGGNDGVLWQCELGSGFEPRPLFAPVARALVATVDRDPAFTPDGGALWFVRRLGAGPLQLQRASSLQGVFDAPASLGREWDRVRASVAGVRPLGIDVRPGAFGDTDAGFRTELQRVAALDIDANERARKDAMRRLSATARGRDMGRSREGLVSSLGGLAERVAVVKGVVAEQLAASLLRLRAGALAVGERLVERTVLDHPSDALYLTLAELEEALMGEPGAYASRVRLRREDDARWANFEAPRRV